MLLKVTLNGDRRNVWCGWRDAIGLGPLLAALQVMCWPHAASGQESREEWRPRAKMWRPVMEARLGAILL